MNEIIPFHYDSKEVRVIRDDEGNPWWVAKDVCEVLEFGNPRQAVATHLDEDEKAVHSMDTPGGTQNLTIINESGLYALILRSSKQEARKFRKWVTSEVLPAIRKTGKYEAPVEKKPDFEVPKKITFAMLAREKRGAFLLAKSYGLDDNQANLSSTMAIKAAYGPDCMKLWGITHLIADSQEQHLTPSDIGKLVGDVSAQKVNIVLENLGFQAAFYDHKNRKKWEATEAGVPFSIRKDTNKKHKDGTPVTQLFWKTSILDHVKRVFV